PFPQLKPTPMATSRSVSFSMASGFFSWATANPPSNDTNTPTPIKRSIVRSMTQPPCLGLIPCLDVVSTLVAGDVAGDPAKGVVHHDDHIGLVLARFGEIEAKLPIGVQT